jgi:hypothetical protein
MTARPSAEKRRKEKLRQDRKRDKAERREQRKAERAQRPDRGEGVEDPDIAGIVPGPQPDPEDDEPRDGEVTASKLGAGVPPSGEARGA